MSGTVVVGAGQAGAALVAKLRALGEEGPITLVGAERQPPYQRPPLSKAYLLGEMDEARLYLRPEGWYADKDITLRLGAPVTGLDTAARTLTLGGESIAWDRLALTTGALPNRLPAPLGGDLEGVFTVRTLADVDRMAPCFQPGARVLVVGGGYIGLEAAAVAANKGLRVTLVEMAERILGRVAARETSDWFRALHVSHGVEIVEGAGVSRLSGERRVTAAELTDGRRVDTDFVVVGTGIRPDTRLAEAAGIACGNGIRVDAFGRTSAPAVWAAGDCANLPWKGRRLRLESVQNAIDQAEAVAADMAGQGAPYDPVPWFWSDQYDVKLQIAGLNEGYDRVVARGGGAGEATSHWYFKGDRLLAVDAMNAPRDYMVGKRLLEMGRSPSPGAVADQGTDLKALLKP